MKAKDLFTIILKLFGIYLIKDVFVAIPVVLDIFYKYFQYSEDVAVFSLFVALLNFAMIFGIVYLLLFKTEWLISKLQLTANISDEPLVLNLHRSSVLTIAIIVSDIVILAFSIPQLIREIYTWYEYLDARNGIFGPGHFEFGPLLTALAEVFVGFLFLGNQRTLVNFIEARRRGSKVD